MPPYSRRSSPRSRSSTRWSHRLSMSLPMRSKTYCMNGLHQCSARIRLQSAFCSASKYLRCSSSCSSIFLSGVSPSGTASTGRNTPQTKALLSPGTATARHFLRPCSSATAAIAASVAAQTGSPRRSSLRSRQYCAA